MNIKDKYKIAFVLDFGIVEGYLIGSCDDSAIKIIEMDKNKKDVELFTVANFIPEILRKHGDKVIKKRLEIFKRNVKLEDVKKK